MIIGGISISRVKGTTREGASVESGLELGNNVVENWIIFGNLMVIGDHHFFIMNLLKINIFLLELNSIIVVVDTNGNLILVGWS